ncbi:MAG TPA: hypothetical protein VHX11_05910 [Acidobacteriaceae bacterium]|jgi:hypothetical protein|nr:hypothetical protein [Acidobacteriaceae bacterium]
MRTAIAAIVFSALSVGTPCLFAAPAGNTAPDPAVLAELQAKANVAEPRDRCFLYAKVVAEMTVLAGYQLNSGDSGKASATLQAVQHYAQIVKDDVGNDSRRLKNAELLLQQTSFRLRDILQSASYDDRPPVEATLKQLDQVQSQVMMQVFSK